MNRLGITQPLPVVRMGFYAILCVYFFLSCSIKFKSPPLLNTLVRKIEIHCPTTHFNIENLKVAPNPILRISRYKERLVRTTSAETDGIVLCILSINS